MDGNSHETISILDKARARLARASVRLTIAVLGRRVDAASALAGAQAVHRAAIALESLREGRPEGRKCHERLTDVVRACRNVIDLETDDVGETRGLAILAMAALKPLREAVRRNNGDVTIGSVALRGEAQAEARLLANAIRDHVAATPGVEGAAERRTGVAAGCWPTTFQTATPVLDAIAEHGTHVDNEMVIAGDRAYRRLSTCLGDEAAG